MYSFLHAQKRTRPSSARGIGGGPRESPFVELVSLFLVLEDMWKSTEDPTRPTSVLCLNIWYDFSRVKLIKLVFACWYSRESMHTCIANSGHVQPLAHPEVNRREVSMYQPISSPTDERPSATSTASRHLLAWLLNRSFVVDIRYATYRRNKFATKLRELVKDRDRACWRVTVRFHADQALLIAQSLRIYYRVLDNCIRQLLLGELNDYRDYVRNRQFTTRSVFLIDQIEISPLSLSTDVAVINLAEHHQ